MGYYEKIILTMIALICLSNCSLSVQAKQEDIIPFNDAFQGINYEVHILQIIDNPEASTLTDSKYVEICISYSGNITPPRTYTYKGTLNGIDYSGTLTISAWNYYNGITDAYYKGTVYAL